VFRRLSEVSSTFCLCPRCAICGIVNRDAPPFDDPDLRRAMALALDRKSFIDILSEGQFTIGGAMIPPPEGVWRMPPDMLKTLPGYNPMCRRTKRRRER
jgi:peptide/nickel transport system substrate-binding protein